MSRQKCVVVSTVPFCSVYGVGPVFFFLSGFDESRSALSGVLLLLLILFLDLLGCF